MLYYFKGLVGSCSTTELLLVLPILLGLVRQVVPQTFLECLSPLGSWSEVFLKRRRFLILKIKRNITYNFYQDAVFLLDLAVSRSGACVTYYECAPLKKGAVFKLYPLLRTVLQHSSDALGQLAQELTI